VIENKHWQVIHKEPFGQEPFGQEQFGQEPFGQEPFGQVHTYLHTLATSCWCWRTSKN